MLEDTGRSSADHQDVTSRPGWELTHLYPRPPWACHRPKTFAHNPIWRTYRPHTEHPEVDVFAGHHTG
ncbi:hypothetical protein BVC93_21660 [Mycobacterium sp. MS1601]|nr:hypothetical protein BVC93_21660 [Mycobacterium sp. MS1601]